MSRGLSGLTGGALAVVLTVVGLVAGGAAAPAAFGLSGQDGAPSGGGYGCKSNGNCNGSLYKDKSNLDKWWYRRCSNCHVVQAPPPPDVRDEVTPFQQRLLSNRQQFWAFHADAEADPVLRRLTPKTRMVPIRNVPSPYRELLNR